MALEGDFENSTVLNEKVKHGMMGKRSINGHLQRKTRVNFFTFGNIYEYRYNFRANLLTISL